MPASNMTADQRRTQTVETVIVLAGRQNPSEITTAEIAKHMSVTQGALFRHFPTKDAIWQSVMEWVADRLLDRLDRAVEGVQSPVEALQAMFMSHMAFVIEFPGVPRMMFAELQHARATPAKQAAHALMRSYGERVSRQIEGGKTSGEIASETDTRAAAILFIGTIQGLVMQSMISGDLKSARSNADGVLALYLRGLCANSATAAPKTSRRSVNSNRGRQT